MSFYKFLISLILLFVLRPDDATDIWSAEEYVKLYSIPSITIKAGGQETALVSFKIKPGYHIMADEVENENFLPTELDLSGTGEIQFGPLQFPAPKEHDLMGSEEVMQVFDGTLTVKMPISVRSDAPKGPRPVSGILFYQACDSMKCYFPRELAFQMMVHVK